MSEFNGDYALSGYVLGISWSLRTMTASPTNFAGSYFESAGKFNNRRLVGSNGSAVMAGVNGEFSNNCTFSSPNTETEMREGFSYPELFTMSPDIWFMNADYTDANFTLGVRWGVNEIIARDTNGVAGNWDGRSALLQNKIFRAFNGAEITVVSERDGDICGFTTNNTEAEVRAGFEFPNMWEYIGPVTGGAGDCLPDCKYNALIALGFTGHVNDMELAYLQSLGAISDQINDAWLEVAGAGQYNDQVMAYMIAQGAVGEQFNDVELSYWCDVVTPPPVGAFSDGFSTGFDV